MSFSGNGVNNIHTVSTTTSLYYAEITHNRAMSLHNAEIYRLCNFSLRDTAPC